MAENRGGFRPTAPQNNPANVSATGGAGQSGTQPARYISGMPYGQGQEMMTQQMSAPMAGPNQAVSAMPLDMAAMAAVTPLTAPTERPNEPLTAGMDFGMGPGSEALNLPAERSLSDILASMIDIDPTGEIQELYDFVAIRGL
jgi:hypothetical protein